MSQQRRGIKAGLSAGMALSLAIGAGATAQVPSSPATGGGPSWAGYGNPIPAGANPYTTPYANPYTSPMASPFLNPYFAATTDPGAAGLMYMLAAQRTGNGIGSGKLGGPRAVETFRPAVAAPVPATRTSGHRGTAGYFQRPMTRRDSGTRYFQRSHRR